MTESPGTPRDSQYEHFAGAKVHGHISHQRREEGHDQSTDDAAAEGSEHCNGQSLAGLSLLAHGVTVQQGGGSSRGAGGMDQDGRDRAAVHTAAVDAQQQADGRDQIHTKRERNKQRHTHGGGHARDRAQQNAAVQAVPLPKKADFYASAAQAQQFPYLSAACFSVLLFPLLRFCSSLHFFTQTPQSCISKIRSFGGGALKKFALPRQQYRQKQYRSYIFLPRERNGTVIKLRSHFASS